MRFPMRGWRVLAASSLAVAATLGCSTGVHSRTALEHEIAVKCVNCHALPTPGQLDRATARAVMTDHWKRAHLTEAQGESIAVWLSTPPQP